MRSHHEKMNRSSSFAQKELPGAQPEESVESSAALTLGQCLNMLHKDLVLVDMARPGKPTYPVSKWKKMLPLDEPGYELRTTSFNHGRTHKKSIAKIGGSGLWNEW